MKRFSIRNIKYVKCKHILSSLVDTDEWQNQPVDVFTDIDGKKIGEAYLDYSNCPSCQNKEVRNVAS